MVHCAQCIVYCILALAIHKIKASSLFSFQDIFQLSNILIIYLMTIVCECECFNVIVVSEYGVFDVFLMLMMLQIFHLL